ncbi:type III effector protein (plasmid) [Ralstonia pseudosolanacearum]|uniref:Type III effector protein n=1 Tax=Ralstonia solanacearum TaxID=305 RepID=A0AA92QE38_RALSL|nr:type III effector protein [Ralstonia pseudosolanacearum]
MSKHSLRFPSILSRHTAQTTRDTTTQGNDPPATAPNRQRQSPLRGLLPIGKRRGADSPPGAGTQTGSPPRVTAASPRLSRQASRAGETGPARQVPTPHMSDDPSLSGSPGRQVEPDTASLQRTGSGRIDADALAGHPDQSDAGWGIRFLHNARLRAAREAGGDAATAIQPHAGPTPEIEAVPVSIPPAPAPAPVDAGTKPARDIAVLPLNRQTPSPSPPSISPTRAKARINRLPSGPKIDGMPEPWTSMRGLDHETLSALTEALGLGPLDPAPMAHEAQVDQAGRLLRKAIIESVELPLANTVRKLPFFEGLVPGVQGQLGLATSGADCVISERERHGKHLLRVQFRASIDRGDPRLGTQPESPNYRAVEIVAQGLADAINPEYRTDQRHYEIEFVSASKHKDSSAAVFIEHFAKHARVAKPRQIKVTAATINDAHLRNSDVFRALNPEQMNKLARAADIAHLNFEEETSTRDGRVSHNLRLFFGGTQNLRDYGQAAASATGGVGSVLSAARKAAQITAQAIDALQREGHEVRFDFIGGASMGGAAAQVFAAALQSRIKLAAPAPLVLLDPQLLNRAQARHATKGGEHEYDFASPRGVAITLDYPADPRKSLMGRMKGLGYSYPGLVRIHLALQEGDRCKQLDNGDWVDRPPKAYGPPLTGYHGDPSLYKKAVLRFTGNMTMRL